MEEGKIPNTSLPLLVKLESYVDEPNIYLCASSFEFSTSISLDS